MLQKHGKVCDICTGLVFCRDIISHKHSIWCFNPTPPTLSLGIKTQQDSHRDFEKVVQFLSIYLSLYLSGVSLRSRNVEDYVFLVEGYILRWWSGWSFCCVCLPNFVLHNEGRIHFWFDMRYPISRSPHPLVVISSFMGWCQQRQEMTVCYSIFADEV